MKRSFYLKTAIALGAMPLLESAAVSAKQPNILFITCEDTNPHWGCYEGSPAITPNIDTLAVKGIRYDRMFGVHSICAPNRSAIITGMYPQSLGSMHMRCKTNFPESFKLFPQLLREAGYYCSNNYKQDYNFEKTPKGTWDDNGHNAHWKNRKPGQPFYAVFNYIKTHEGFVAKERNWKSGTRQLKKNERCDPADVPVPPYYPDTPQVRKILARSYDNIRVFDRYVEKRVNEVKEAGLADNTIIMVMSDHGDGFPRMKRSLFDSGMRVPFVVYIPEKYRITGQAEPGTATGELVSFVDLGPTILNLCGIRKPEWIQGQAFLGPNRAEPRTYVYGGRDRGDSRYSLQRTIRDSRYRFTRDYRPDLPELLDLRAARLGDLWKELQTHRAKGTLSQVTASYFNTPSPMEELYDTDADPYETNNLADDPNLADVKARLAKELLSWQREIGDSGFIPEGMLETLKEQGSVYEALRTREYSDWPDKALAAARQLIAPEKPTERQMLAAAQNDCPPVRWWGLFALEYYGADGPDVEKLLAEALDDEWPDNRIAAVRAAYKLGKAGEAEQAILKKELFSENEGVRCAAALVFDRYAGQMRPLLPVMREAAKQTGPGRAINNLMNNAFRQLDEPEIEWMSWK
jgi:uncharacterized sulfatase